MTYWGMRGTDVPWHTTGTTPLSRATTFAASTTGDSFPSGAFKQLLVDAALVMTTFGTHEHQHSVIADRRHIQALKPLLDLCIDDAREQGSGMRPRVRDGTSI